MIIIVTAEKYGTWWLEFIIVITEFGFSAEIACLCCIYMVTQCA